MATTTRINAAQYLRNVGKSLGYAFTDSITAANPTVSAMFSQTKEQTTNLYHGIKDIKSKFSDFTNSGVGKEYKDIAQEGWSNLVSDLKTGKWYNKEREDSSMMSAFGMDMDFDFDDFGDFDLNEEKEQEIAAEMDVQTKNTQTTVNAMDAVGRKTSAAISAASVYSADYIVRTNKANTNAMFKLNSEGFSTVASGIASVNSNIGIMVEMAKPLTQHMQNSALFYTKTNEYQEKSLKLLEQIAANTAPKLADNRTRGSKQITIMDLVSSDGTLNFDTIKKMGKDAWKNSSASMMLSMLDAFGGPQAALKMLLANPLSMAMTGGFDAILKSKGKKNTNRSSYDAMSDFNDVLAGLVPGAIGKLKRTDFSKTNLPWWIQNALIGVKQNLPKSGLKKNIDTSNYEKGRVDWDGMSRKALMDVIPTQLGKILAALTGEPEQRFDYKSGKWVKVTDIYKIHNDRLSSASRRAGGEMYSEVRRFVEKSNLSKEDKKSYQKQLEAFMNEMLLNDNEDFLDFIDSNKEFNYDKYKKQISRKTLEDARAKFQALAAKNPKYTKSYAGDWYKARADYGREMQASTGEITESLHNQSLSGKNSKTGKVGNALINGNILLNSLDQFDNNIFYYLQGIWQNTGFMVDNFSHLVSGSIPTTTTSSGAVTLTPVRKLSKADHSQHSNAPKNYKRNNYKRTRDITVEDNDNTIGQGIASEYDGLKPEVVKYLKEKQEAESKGKSFKINKEMEEAITQWQNNKNARDKFTGFTGKIKNKLLDNKYIGEFANMAGTTTDAVVSILDGASKQINSFIYGTNGNEESFGKIVSDSVKGIFSQFTQSVSNLIPDFLKKWARDMGLPEKWDNFKKGVKDQIKNWFGPKTNPEAETGASGSGLHSFYRRLNAIYDSTNAMNFNGWNRPADISIDGDVISFDIGAGKSRSRKRRERRTKANRTSSSDDAAAAAPDENASASTNIISGIVGNVSKFIINKLKGNTGKDESSEKERQKINEKIDGLLKDTPAAKYAIGAGAAIGGGLSLVTGAAIGPIAAAAVGAAAGFVSKSETAQKILFGDIVEEKDEKTGKVTKSRTGGMLPKNISNFLEKQAPSIFKAGTVGTALGVLTGSPVAGAILGSAIGYVKSSDAAKEFLFGKINEDGTETKGLIPKSWQDALKSKLPAVGLGGAAGLLIGPFGPVGNIIMGSALGFAADTNKFKDWMFGKPDKDGKRGKFGEGGFSNMLKKSLFMPIVDLFKNLASTITSTIKNTFEGIGKKLRETILHFLSKKLNLGPLAKIGRGIGKAVKGVGKGIYQVVTEPIRGASEVSRKFNINTGKTAYLNGKEMTAAERLQYRKDNMLFKGDELEQNIDEYLSSISNDSEKLEAFKKASQLYKDPTKAIDQDIMNKIGGVKESFSETAKGQDEKIKNAIHKIYKNNFKNGAIKDYDKAISDVEKLSELGISQDKINKIKKQMESIKESSEQKNLAKNNPEEFRKKISETYGIDKDVANLFEKAKDKNINNAVNKANIEINKLNSEKKEVTVEEQQVTVLQSIETTINKIHDAIVNRFGGGKKKNKNKGAKSNQKDEKASESETTQTTETTDSDKTAGEDETTVDQYGNIVENEGSTNVKQKRSAKATILAGIGSIPIIGTALNKVSSVVGKISTGLFGSKDKKEDGFFSKIISSLTGENGVVGKFINWISGGKFASLKDVGTIISDGLTKFGPIIAKALGITALVGAITGAFDPIAKALSSRGTTLAGNDTVSTIDNNQTMVTSDGTHIKVVNGKPVTDENGNYIATDGTTVSKNEKLQSYGTDNRLSTQLKTNFVTKTIMGQGGSVIEKAASKILTGDANKINIAKAAKDIAANGATSGLFTAVREAISTAIANIPGILKKIPFLPKAITENADNIGMTLMEHFDDALKGAGTKLGSIASKIGPALGVINAAIIAAKAVNAWGNAESILGITEKATFGQRIIATLIATVNAAIPFVGDLIPNKVLVNIFMKICEKIGIEGVEGLAEQRKQAQADVDAYNESMGLTGDDAISIEEYNQMGLERQADGSFTKGKARAGIFTQAKNGIKSFVTNHKEGIKTGIKAGIGVAAMSNPVTAALYGGFQAVKFFKNGGTVQSAVTAIADSAKTLFEYAKKGDIKGLMAVKYEGDEEDPNNGVYKAIFTLNKVIQTPVALISALGHGIGKIFKGVFDTGKKIVNNYAGSEKQRLKYIYDGDIKALLDSKYQSEDEGIIGKIFGVRYDIEKVMSVPACAISLVGHCFANVFKGIIDKAKEMHERYKQQRQFVDEFVQSGNTDINEFLRIDESTYNTDNPLSGIYVTISRMERLIALPGALLRAAGKGISEGFRKLVDKAKTGIATLKDMGAKQDEYVANGDPVGLMQSSYEDDEGNPIGGIGKGIYDVTKIIKVVPATIKYIGNDISNYFKQKVESIQEDASGISESFKTMKAAADEGDISGVWSTAGGYFNREDKSPISGIFNAIAGIGGVFFTVTAVINKLLGPIKEILGGVKETVDNVVSGAKEKISNFKDAAKEKIEGVKDKVTSTVSNIKDAAKEKVEAAKNWLGNAWDALSGKGSGMISQRDPRYAGMNMGGRSVGDMGCGPASAVNALNVLGRRPSMKSAVNLASQYQTSGGTDLGYFADEFGRNGVRSSYVSGRSMVDAVASGTPTVLMGRDPYNTSKSRSPFGPNNHYVVANGIDKNGNVNISDPELSTTRKYSPSILKNVKAGVAAMGSRFGFGGGKAQVNTKGLTDDEKPKTKSTAPATATKATAIVDANPTAAVPAASVAAQANITTSGDSKLAIWRYLTSNGFNDYAAAGLMGCWEIESGNNPRRIEADYIKKFPGYDKVMASNASLNDYTLNILFPAYNGKSINKKAYLGNDGNYYPGIGLAQWTGPRGYNIIQYAKNKGKGWDDLQTQLEFAINASGEFKSRLNGTLLATMNAAGSIEKATELAFTKYEGCSMKNTTGYNKRVEAAKHYYNTYSGKTYTGGIFNGIASSNATFQTTTGSDYTSSGTEIKGIGDYLSAITGAFSNAFSNIFNKGSSTTTSGSTSITGYTPSTYDATPISAEAAEGDRVNGIPYFNQTEDPWAKIQYSSIGDKSQTIKSSGCGPTSMSMVLKSFGQNATPKSVAEWSVANGYRTANDGTSWGLFKNIGDKAQLNVKQFSSTEDAKSYLRKGFPVIASMGPGDFTKGGHYVVLSGIDGDNFMVNDPASRYRSKTLYPTSKLSQSKQFWAFSKDNKGTLTAGEARYATHYDGGSGSGLYYDQSTAGNRILLDNSGRFSAGDSTLFDTAKEYVSGKLMDIQNRRNQYKAAESSNANNNASATMSKETALMLKALVSLATSIVDNTSKIGDIFEVVKEICNKSDNPELKAISNKMNSSYKPRSSTDNTTLESLNDLRSMVDSVLG